MILLYISLLFCGCSYGIYIDDTHPYEPGTLLYSEVYPGDDNNQPPLHTKVFYPVQEGSPRYAALLFIGGFYGMIPGEFYDDIFEMIAQKGYVVIAPWPLLDMSLETLVENILWLQTYWDLYIPVKASWNHLSVACHSAGCDNIVDLLRNFPDFNFKSAIHLEPMSFFMNEDMPSPVPGLMYGTELSDGHCSFLDLSFRQFIKHWKCPKTLIEVAGFGHCDVLTQWAWETCDEFEFCPRGPRERLAEYRGFVAGLMVAFMNTYSQGSAGYIPYFTDRGSIPMELTDLRHEETCPNK